MGFEQDGGREFLRPVVILRKFNNDIFWGIPFTKAGKKKHKNTDKYYYTFSFLPEVASLAILSQIRLIDAKRLSRHVATMTKGNFEELNKKFNALVCR